MKLKLLLLFFFTLYASFSQSLDANSKTSKSNALEKHRIWLNMTNTEGAFKQTLIGYIQGATNGIDDDFDGVSLDANPYLDFYSLNSGTTLVIQGRALPFSDLDEVVLGYRSLIDGSFTIAIDHADGMLATHPVYLEDKDLNIMHDLQASGYTFETNPGVFRNRFVLKYKNQHLANQDFERKDPLVSVWTDNHSLNISSSQQNIQKVLLYNITGKLVYENSIAAKETVVKDFIPNNELLLVKIILENNEIETKKIIY